MLVAGSVKELCVLALNAPLLVQWFFYSFPLAASHTHACVCTHGHTHFRLHKQTLVLKMGRIISQGTKCPTVGTLWKG